jgi:farnesyl diphosphate synthase
MDDDDLRRGRPTTHKQYGEAAALLVGDALQPLAFELLAQMPIAPALIVQSVELLARAAGSAGMAGGQFIDYTSAGVALTHEQLQAMDAMKTGAMLQASILLGGIVAGASSQQLDALEDYAEAAGIAFQVADDILDVVADTATLGKTAGKDAAAHKPTYVSLLGLDTARELLGGLRKASHEALRPLGAAGARLGQLADFIAERDH